MTDFIVFDPETGQIKRTGSCLLAIVYLQCVDGECVIQGTASVRDSINIETLEVIKA